MRYSIKNVLNEFNTRPIIVIYGSSTCNEDSELYALALEVGHSLSKKYIVASGGYTGIMDAVSKGSHMNKGIVIGITTDEITRAEPSRFLTKEFREYSLMTRLELMQNIAKVHLFLPGSTGTLTELALVWDKQKLGLLPSYPILLLGMNWHKIYELMFKKNNEVPLSKWKLDKKVEQNTIILNSIDEFKSWILSYKNI